MTEALPRGRSQYGWASPTGSRSMRDSRGTLRQTRQGISSSVVKGIAARLRRHQHAEIRPSHPIWEEMSVMGRPVGLVFILSGLLFMSGSVAREGPDGERSPVPFGTAGTEPFANTTVDAGLDRTINEGGSVSLSAGINPGGGG